MGKRRERRAHVRASKQEVNKERSISRGTLAHTHTQADMTREEMAMMMSGQGKGSGERGRGAEQSDREKTRHDSSSLFSSPPSLLVSSLVSLSLTPSPCHACATFRSRAMKDLDGLPVSFFHGYHVCFCNVHG